MRALALYDRVPAYSQVNRSIRRVHELLDRVEARENALVPPQALPGEDFAPVPADTAGQ